MIESCTMKIRMNDEETVVESQSKTEPLNEAQRVLATKYMPMANTMALAFSRHCKWMADELESVALLALVEAARFYDDSYNVKFSTYAKNGIIGALTNARNKYIQLHRTNTADVDGQDRYATVNNSSNLTQEEYDTYLQTIDESRDFFSTDRPFEYREELEHLFKRLPHRHRSLMQALYFEQKSIDELRKRFRCQSRRLEVMHRESINMLLSGDPVPMPRKSRRPKAFVRAIDPHFSDKTVPDRTTGLNES